MKKAAGVFFLLVLLSIGMSAYAFDYVVDEGFESGSLEDYSITAKNGATAQIVSEDSFGENHYLEMTSAGTAVSLVQRKFTPLDDIAIFDIDFIRESNEGGGVRIMQIYDSAVKTRSFLLTSSKTGFVVRIGEKQTPITVPGYGLGVWYKIRAVLDFNTKTYDLYINGHQYCDDNAFFYADAADAGCIQTQIDTGTGNGKCKIDNLRIYGLNNGELDEAILEAEKKLDTYSIGNLKGEYTKTRYEMLCDNIEKIRELSKQEMSEDERIASAEQLDTYIAEFEASKITDEGEAGEIFANDISFANDGETIFTSDSNDINYALLSEITDNCGRIYDAMPLWELTSAPESVELNENTLVIPSGTQGIVKLRATVDNIYRNFKLYLRDYSKVDIKEITAKEGSIKIKGTLTRNSEDEVTLKIVLGESEYSSVITEDESGNFECVFELSPELVTTDAELLVEGTYVHSLNKSFVYFGPDAADAALARIESGSDEEIVKTLNNFSEYLDVHTDTLSENEEEYVKMLKAGIPYSSPAVLNDKLKEINLIIEINVAVRGDIETVITGGMEILEKNGFDVNKYNALSSKNKNQFFVKAADVSGTDIFGICTKLNNLVTECSETTSVTTGGGGGGGGGGSYTPPSTGSNVVSQTGNSSSVLTQTDTQKDYIVTPVTEDGKPYEEPKTDSVNNVSGFLDESDAEWAKDAMHELRGRGIIEGYENYIRPNDPVTRGEMAKMLVEAFNIAPDTETKDGGSWWQSYAQRGMESGIITGYEDGDFHGEDLLTRQDMAVLLSRIVDYNSIGVYNKEELNQFNDDNEISAYAKSAVYDLQQYGILSGIGKNMFSPRSYVTRAQAVVAIYNLLTTQT